MALHSENYNSLAKYLESWGEGIESPNFQHNKACMAINEQGRPTFIAGEHTNSVEILETRSTHLNFFLLEA